MLILLFIKNNHTKFSIKYLIYDKSYVTYRYIRNINVLKYINVIMFKVA